MNKSYPVLVGTYSTITHSFLSIKQILDVERLPLYIKIYVSNANTENLLKAVNSWFLCRSIPAYRRGIDTLLYNLGIHDRMQLVEECYAASLSDQYWLKPDNESLTWADVNFFKNKFSSLDFSYAIFEKDYKRKIDLNTPNGTCDGMLPKVWILQGNQRFLLKNVYTPYNQEPINEWLASEICEALSIEHVPYELFSWGNHIFSKCPCCISEDEEIVPADDIFFSFPREEESDLDHYSSSLEKLGLDGARDRLEEMLLIDFLIMNVDRHMKNYGAIRNIKTLEWRILPIFDNGESMNCQNSLPAFNFDDGVGRIFTQRCPFSSYLGAIKNIQRFDMAKLENLPDRYYQKLKECQNEMRISNDRIVGLTEGLKHRIDEVRYSQSLD